MFWITLETENEIEYMDATDFLLNGKTGDYRIHLADGSERNGRTEDIKYLHVQEKD